MKNLLFLAGSLFIFTNIQSQNESSFGKITQEDIDFKVYEKDTTANAVYLFDSGSADYQVKNGRILLYQKYHARIKILSKEGIDQSTVEIPFYHTNSTTEKIQGLKAMTYFNGNQQFVEDNDVFTTDELGNWKEMKFTFPNVQKGSILEYEYTIVSPFIFLLRDWYFQDDIPKLSSKFHALIPANYVFNKALVGTLPLSVNDVTLKKRCFYLPNARDGSDCESLTFAMENIPAYNFDEEYLLGWKNYLSRLSFELSEFIGFSGNKEKYTDSWKSVDRKFRQNKSVGGQLTKKGFFERNVPNQLFEESNELSKAKKIYDFVKSHYTWDKTFGRYGKASVKSAFDERQGSAAEINMALINLLNAADIPTNLMLLSTRQNGLPKKSHPVMDDFNYFIAKTSINGQTYLLDATDKLMPFGRLPFKCLNHYGRVMDFKEDSYWQDIVALGGNRVFYKTYLSFDTDAKTFKGMVDMVNTGYHALSRKRVINEYSNEDDYLEYLEGRFENELEIDTYTFFKEKSTDEKTLERFTFNFDGDFDAETIFFNPFMMTFFEKNPFLDESRNQPADFGHSRDWKYQINLTVPNGYEVSELPEKREIQLGDNLGLVRFTHLTKGPQLTLVFELKLDQTYFPAENYAALKELFSNTVDIQKNSLVVFKKL
ncbi:MAG: DUF3857 and transglutaminase domain-containing protein [Flavobacteriaceae bacterium]